MIISSQHWNQMILSQIYYFTIKHNMLYTSEYILIGCKHLSKCTYLIFLFENYNKIVLYEYVMMCKYISFMDKIDG